MPVIGVGLISDRNEAERVINENEADIVAVGCGMLFNPRLG